MSFLGQKFVSALDLPALYDRLTYYVKEHYDGVGITDFALLSARLAVECSDLPQWVRLTCSCLSRDHKLTESRALVALTLQGCSDTEHEISSEKPPEYMH